MLFEEPTIYCVDTNVWIDLNRHYPKDIFPSLWKIIEGLINSKRIVIPKEVKKEIARGTDDLMKWIQDNDVMVITADYEQIEALRLILAKFEEWVDVKGKNAADPFVVALALSRGYSVVTAESFDLKRLKIPRVCHEFDVCCLNMLDFMREIGIQY